jgi:dihydroorotase-like cyclic amidohydrolase
MQAFVAGSDGRPVCLAYQPAVLFSQKRPATNNQPTILFSLNKPATNHQANEESESDKSLFYGFRALVIVFVYVFRGKLMHCEVNISNSISFVACAGVQKKRTNK